MRKIFSFAFCLLSFYCFYGQGLPGAVNAKAVRFVNALDSAQVISLSSINGTIYYNEQSNKFRVYENGVWRDLFGGGGGGGTLIGADNGLSVNADSVIFGGSAIDRNTEIPINISNYLAFGDIVTPGMNLVIDPSGNLFSQGISLNSTDQHGLFIGLTSMTAANESYLFSLENGAGGYSAIANLTETAGSSSLLFRPFGANGTFNIRPLTANQSNIFLVEEDTGADIFRLLENVSGTNAEFTPSNSFYVNSSTVNIESDAQTNIYSASGINFLYAIGGTVVGADAANTQLFEVQDLGANPILDITQAGGLNNVTINASGSADISSDGAYYGGSPTSTTTLESGSDFTINSLSGTFSVNYDGGNSYASFSSGLLDFYTVGSVNFGIDGIGENFTVYTTGSGQSIVLNGNGDADNFVELQGPRSELVVDPSGETGVLISAPGVNSTTYLQVRHGGLGSDFFELGIGGSGSTYALINSDIISASSLTAPAGQTYAVTVDDNGILASQAISGITNTAANNELAKSDGTNLVPSGVFALPSNGNVQLGSASITGNRTLAVVSSTTNASLTVSSQGTGNLILDANATGQYQFGESGDGGTSRTVNAISSSGNTTFNFNSQGTGDFNLNTGNDMTLTSTGTNGDIELVANGAGSSFIALRSTVNQIIFESPVIHTFLGDEDLIFNPPLGDLHFNSNSVSIVPLTISGTRNNGASGEDTGDIVITSGDMGSATGSGAASTGSTTITTGTVTAGSSNKTVGDLFLYTGLSNGTGTPGNINIDARDGGEIFFPTLRTDCTGAPTGAVYNNSGVLSICP